MIFESRATCRLAVSNFSRQVAVAKEGLKGTIIREC